MSAWDYLSETLSQAPSMEEFKKGLGYLKDKGMDFLQATSMFSPETVAPLNKQASDFASWVNESQVGKAIAQGAQAVQESGVDYGVPVVGALWKPTSSFLKKLSPEHYNALNSTDKNVLQLATDAYPSVKNAKLEYGLSDGFFAPPAETRLGEYLSGKAPGRMQITDPQNYNLHPLEKELSSPAISYLHEGGTGHALTGGSRNLASWGKFEEPNFLMYDNPSRIAVEGFAEGGSHAAMNKYNKEVLAPYWQDYRNYPFDLKNTYLKSGYLGADVGSDLRKGLVPDQQKVIDELLSILKGVY